MLTLVQFLPNRVIRVFYIKGPIEKIHNVLTWACCVGYWSYCIIYKHGIKIMCYSWVSKPKEGFKAVLRIRFRIRSDPVFLGHPDPEPGKYRIRIRILYPQKDLMLFKFSRIKLSEIQFSPHNFFIFDFKCHNNFLFFILSVIGCLDLVRKWL